MAQSSVLSHAAAPFFAIARAKHAGAAASRVHNAGRWSGGVVTVNGEPCALGDCGAEQCQHLTELLPRAGVSGVRPALYGLRGRA